MRKRRASKINQIVVGVLLTLSLCTSSIAACICAHDATAQTQIREHCSSSSASNQRSAENSSHSHKTVQAEDHHNNDSTAKSGSLSVSENESCCVKRASRIAAKVESFKIEKQTAAIAAGKYIETIVEWRALPFKIIRRPSPFYLSDSFYNLSPGRAPPSPKA